MRRVNGLWRFALAAGTVAFLAFVWAVLTQWGGAPVDAYAYWQTDPSAPYRIGVDYQYAYPPVWIQLVSPLLALPFAAFAALLRAGELVALFLLAGPASLVAVWLPPVAAELNAANVNLLLMACVVGGFRWPVLWAPVLLTKPSAGVGLLWFVARGEWRRLVPLVLVVGALCLASFVYRPDLWWAWLRFLGAYGDTPGWPFPIPLWPRLPLAVALCWWGARSGHRWAVVLGTIVAWPRLYFLSIAQLVALIPVLRLRRGDDRGVLRAEGVPDGRGDGREERQEQAGRGVVVRPRAVER